MLEYLLYIFVFFYLLYYIYFTRTYSYWKLKNVPHDEPVPFFGNFYKVAIRKQQLGDLITSIYNKYENVPYVGIYIFNSPRLIIKSPELIKTVLVKDFNQIPNRHIAANENVDPVAFHTLFSAKDSTWRAVRNRLSPVFTSGKIKLMIELVRQCGTNLEQYLAARRPINGELILDIKTLSRKYAVDVIASCAFGIDANSLKAAGDDEHSEMETVAEEMFNINRFSRAFALFSYFFAPAFVDIFRIKMVDPIGTNYLINAFRKVYQGRKDNQIVRHDLIDLLHSTNKNNKENEEKDGFKFDEIKMAAQAMSFFTAGNETSSSIIAYTIYELALHMDIQNRLKNEIRTSIDSHNNEFTYESIQEMKYLDMVLSEVLRMYPLTSTLDRQVDKDYTFKETGLTIQKGTGILIPVCGMHFDPDYFPDPHTFDPERFNDINKPLIKSHMYMPFGDGPRICIGQRFALLIVKAALISMLKDYRYEVASGRTPIPLRMNPASPFLLNKDKILLKVVKA